MAESELVKREKFGNVYSENIDTRLDGGRRLGGKPELQPYRPGCGLLPKSPRNEVKEPSGSSSTSDVTRKGHDSMDNYHRAPPLSAYGGSSNGGGGGGGRRPSGRGRSGRGDGRLDRSSAPRDIPVAKVTEGLKQMQVTQTRPNNVNEPVHSENPNQPHSVNDNSKRNKKPDQPIYVSKPVAQSMATSKPRKPKPRNRRKGPPNDSQKVEDWNAETGPHIREMSQEAALRRPSPTTTPHSYDARKLGQGGEGDMRYQEDSNVSGHWGNGQRNVRLGSEPRSLLPQNQSWEYQRTRDTRSVEPTGWNSEKVQAKPPSGRRGSGKDMPYLSNSNKPSSRPFSNSEIPPRFKRMMENGIKDRPSVDRSAHVPPERIAPVERHAPVERSTVATDEVWDGTTKMFSRGGYTNESYNVQHQYYQQQYHSLTSVSLPPTPFYGNVQDYHNQPFVQQSVPQEQFNTIPAVRTRGRGRMRPEDYEVLSNSMPGRSSRPGTPDLHSVSSSGENMSSQGNRGQEDKQGRQSSGNIGPPSPLPPQSSATLSISPPKRHPSVGSCNEDNSSSHGGEPNKRNSASPAPISNVPEITDWSEEVELSEKLEMGTLDGMARSPIAPAVSDTPSSKRSGSSRKTKKRRKDKRAMDDSIGEYPPGRGHGRDQRSNRGPDPDPAGRWAGEQNDGRSERDRERERGRERERELERESEHVWRHDHSHDRERRDQSHERDRGRSRRNSHDQMPPPPVPLLRRDTTPDRDRGRHRRNSGRDHSGERFRQQRPRRNSIRENSADRDWPRHRRNSGRDHSRDRRDHSREGAGGSRRERMGSEWRRGRNAVPDDDWRRPGSGATVTTGPMPLVHSEATNDDWRRGLDPPKSTANGPKPQQTPGLLVLPANNQPSLSSPPFNGRDRDRDRPSHPAPHPPPQHHPHQQHHHADPNVRQRHLYDPNNHTMVKVISPNSRAATTNGSGEERWPVNHIPQAFIPGMLVGPPTPTAALLADQFGNTRPEWYNPFNDRFRASLKPHLILDIAKADLNLQWLLSNGLLLEKWELVEEIRKVLEGGLRTLILEDIAFCHKENADLHLWKIMFHQLIEVLRTNIGEGKPQTDQCRQLLLCIIDQGTEYFENLLADLEEQNNIHISDYMWANGVPIKDAKTATVLVVAQKLYIFLGNLARYREQTCETANYFKARQWYMKAHQLNPKSGRPYNQLAVLAMYARRKLDAVYFYMRALMASHAVVHTARERLISIFDENRKKYEQALRKRREDRAARSRETETSAATPSARTGVRREVWVRPGDGQRDQRTTAPSPDRDPGHSEDEELATLSSVEVNKRFLMSYLHIHGKLFTKVGMESFQESAVLMLREFRTLLQFSPIAINSNRLLQLLALNMAAIDNTQLPDNAGLGPGIRSAAQEFALRVSLQMFGLVLERCVSLLREQLANSSSANPLPVLVNEDIVTLLPAIKIWCDWLLCHNPVWNPPPCLSDYHVGPPGEGDVWSHLASLVTLLEQLGSNSVPLSNTPEEGMVQVRLTEDITMAGFTPLMANPQKPCYAPDKCDMDLAQNCLRIQRLLFFGTVYLCGIDFPVLKVHKDERGRSVYVSVVASAPPPDSRTSSRSGSPTGSASASDPYESLSDDAEASTATTSCPQTLPAEANSLLPDAETRKLLHRKEELERRKQKQEKQRQRVQAIIRESQNVVVEMEVRPQYLVADTNCFVDYLHQIKLLAQAQTYSLRVPLVVLNELEGLARGGRKPGETECYSSEHAARVAKCAKEALEFLRQRSPSVRCVTTKGTTLATTMFTSEEEGDQDVKNDDKILNTCINLCRTSEQDQVKPGEPRRLVRDVVLLTEDRNLRVKALARDVPVRELPDFMQWANLS